MHLPDPPERLARLRALPVGAAVLAGLAGEPGVHVVGGAVRDLLLGGTPEDLDVVVEGDGVALARRAAERLGGGARVVVHERFGTATVRVGDLAFDVASARAETYLSPGALPEVELGVGLAEDLERRDFTVNAMAVGLADGALVTFPGAVEDLVAGRLRVLHAGSFTDDPTRLFRLVRYAGRLEFAVEGRTRALAAAAVAGGALATVSAERIGHELRLALREPQPAVLVALDALGLGRVAVDPAFRVDGLVLGRALELCPADARVDLVCLAACLVAASDARSVLTRLTFPAVERDVVAEGAGRSGAVLRALREGDGVSVAPSFLWRALHSVRVETTILAGALTEEGWVRDAVRFWIAELRHVRSLVGGDDLVRAGVSGKAVGAGLEAALLAALDGRAPTRDAQLAVALSAARAA